MNRYYVKTSSKIKKEKTIFLISDLHYFEQKNIRKYEFILEELKKQKPNCLIIAGDLLDSAIVKEERQLVQFIKECALLTTIIIGIGNHDFTLINKKHTNDVWNDLFWSEIHKINNVFLLNNSQYETEDVCIYGITLPFDYYYGKLDIHSFLKEHVKTENSKKLNILLIHDATAILNDELKDYDFVLSGHTHNGMVPKLLESVMKNSGLISPGKKLFPKRVRGNFKINNTEIIVSGGVTKLSKRSKLDFLDRFWKHEITIIKIKPKVLIKK